MNYKVLILGVIAIFILVLLKHMRIDGFAATSPGTMVQLRTSHVPTEEDAHYYKYIYPKIVAREIRNMTGGDL